ncbi:hypothetical protein [Nocardia sp. 2TAF39]|uniref:hypothetical protein n=1 Tax=Nocardia sp. 2TAF39 TaxID=3233017 RepID=UPI003F9755ED
MHVKAADAVASATLHHPDCQAARWDDNPINQTGPAAALLNFVARAVLLPTYVESTGAQVWRPFLLVNPGLEQVILADHGGQWRVATTNYYAQYGLGAGGEILRVDNTVPNALATLDDSGVVTVLLGDLRAGWSSPCDPELADRIRELDGIALAVSSAFHPAHEIKDLVQEFAGAISEGQVAGGWVRLTTT